MFIRFSCAENNLLWSVDCQLLTIFQSTADSQRSIAESWCDWAKNPNLNTCFSNRHELTVVSRLSTVDHLPSKPESFLFYLEALEGFLLLVLALLGHASVGPWHSR